MLKWRVGCQAGRSKDKRQDAKASASDDKANASIFNVKASVLTDNVL